MSFHLGLGALHVQIDMQENMRDRLRDSRPRHTCDSRNLAHVFSCIFVLRRKPASECLEECSPTKTPHPIEKQLVSYFWPPAGS